MRHRAGCLGGQNQLQPARREAIHLLEELARDPRQWAEQEAGADKEGRLDMGNQRDFARAGISAERKMASAPAGFLKRAKRTGWMAG